jgi:hypothetical protein
MGWIHLHWKEPPGEVWTFDNRDSPSVVEKLEDHQRVYDARKVSRFLKDAHEALLFKSEWRRGGRPTSTITSLVTFQWASNGYSRVEGSFDELRL